jgi:hypothetical protein
MKSIYLGGIMRKTVLLVIIFLITTISLNGQMILTGVIDGPLTGGLPKAIEFYVTDNIGDLSIYGFGSANNGDGSDGEEFSFPSDTANEGDYIYVASEATGFNDFFGFAPDYTSSAALINGDDAIELFKNGSVVDVFGDIDVDGSGEPWEYMDGWAYRNDGTGPDGSTWTLANWYFSGPNALDGETTNATATTPFPTGTYTEGGGGNLPPTITDIATDPSVPKSTDTVDVSANIEDVDGTIASASLFWGLSSGSLTNEITMTATRANYETTTPIPAQSQGTTVYYKIRAIDDEPDTTFTSQRSYSVAYERTIYEIQYTTDPSGDSPDVGNTVITSGILTASFSNEFVFQDGSGVWNGMWVNSDATVLVGDEISLGGTVSESNEKTILTNVTILQQTPGQPLPSASTILTADVNSEQYEGVLIFVHDAECTNVNPDARPDYGEWEITSPGSDLCRVDDLGYAFEPTLGSIYDVTGVVNYSYSNFKIEPRDSSDVVLIGDFDPPAIQNVEAIDSANVEVTFSEDVDEATAETTTNYSITSRVVTVTAAVRDAVDHTVVNLTVNGMTDGNYLLTVINVEDLYNNAIVSDTASFSYTAPQEWDVIINEVDADTPGTDSLEFIELFDGGTGNTDLAGLVVVLFNGNGDVSYAAYDLDGWSTDVDGYFVLGSALVTNVDSVAFITNGIQNGADAVALFQADASDFPNDTPVTTVNLIDAIVYDTNDADDAGLLVLLNADQPQVNEDGAGDKDHHSNQRIPNGSGGKRNTDTYEQHIPTPGEENSTQNATKLFFTDVNGGIYPTVNAPFYVVVQAQDDLGTPQNVILETQFSLSVNTGSGNLGGIINGTIAAATNQVTVNGIIYDTVETGVSLTATRTSGDNLSAGTSSFFDVLTPADHLAFFLVPDSGYVNVDLVQFVVQALRPNESIDHAYTDTVTIAKASGSGNMTGITSRPAISGAAWFTGIQFDAPDTYTMSAASGTLTGAVTGNIVIINPPPPVTGLIISEVADGTGTGGYPKFVELTNTTESGIDITGYRINLYNGNTGSLSTFYVFQARYAIQAGESLVLTNIDNTTSGQLWTDFSLTEPAYVIYSLGVIWGDGNDTYELRDDMDQVVDIYGIVGVNGTGENWEYLDSYSYRLPFILTGNATFTEPEWFFAGVDALDEHADDLSPYLTPGTHTFGEQLPAPENVIITKDGTHIVITWDAVPEATSYKIYSDNDPYGTYSNLEATITDTTWSEIIPIDGKKFYKVTAE